MSQHDNESTGRGIVTIVGVGMLLGIGFNALGLQSEPARGLPWIGKEAPALESLEDLVAEEQPPRPAPGYYNQVNDPMAVVAAVDLPEIPDLDRPVEIGLEMVKRFHDAGAALFVDAREPDEFAAGHIPGALNMPFDEITAEPERMESLDTAGRPIVVYCGGGTCEVSKGLAWELIAAGQRRVAVFAGGFTEWAEVGYPAEAGGPAGT
jgi:rhodanese-related sulfurtransferase